MGHPYSANKAPQNIHVPAWLVHTQSGKLIEAIKVEKTKDGWKVGIDESIAPYAKFVIFGSERMVSRDFITAVFNESRAEIRRILEEDEGE